MKIMIVDDTSFMRATIRQILEHEGVHDITEAENGQEALTKYKINHPDLVIMDISMPIMDGIEAVKQIRAYDEFADIVICSLQGQRENVLKAIQAGARSFLVKPIKREKLLLEVAASQSLSQSTNKKSNDPPEIQASPLAETIIHSPSSILQNNPSREYMQGVERGYLEARREVAINMVNLGLEIEVILQCVGLTEEDLLEFQGLYSSKKAAE